MAVNNNNSDNTITKVSGIKLLHRRKPLYGDGGWYPVQEGTNIEDVDKTLWPKLYPGEFGIDTTNGEVRGNVFKTGTTDTDAVTWDMATKIGSINLELAENGYNASNDALKATTGNFVYGVEPIKQNGSVTGYKLLQKATPQITVSTSQITNTNGFTAISSVEIDYTDAESPVLKYNTVTIPETIINVAQEYVTEGTAEYITSITQDADENDNQIPNSFTIVKRKEKDSSGEFTISNPTVPSIVSGIKFTDNGGTVDTFDGSERATLASSNSELLSIGFDKKEGTDEPDYTKILFTLHQDKFLQNVAGAMIFKGTVDLASSTEGTSIDLDAYNMSTGYTYKVIKSNSAQFSKTVKSTKYDIHVHVDGDEDTIEPGKEVVLEPGDLIVACTKIDDGSSVLYYDIIPSGDDADQYTGTVKSVTVDDGLVIGKYETTSSADLNTGSFTVDGTISHRRTDVANNGMQVGYVPTKFNCNDQAFSTTQNNQGVDENYKKPDGNDPSVDDVKNIYRLVNYIAVDKNTAGLNLGHVNDIRYTDIKIHSEDEIKKIADDANTTYNADTLLQLNTSTNTFSHKAVTAPSNIYSDSSDQQVIEPDTVSNEIGYVTGVQTDGYGHVTKLLGKKAVVKDTWRGIQVGGTDFKTTTTESGVVNFTTDTSEKYLQLDRSDNNNDIVFKTNIPVAPTYSEDGIPGVIFVGDKTESSVSVSQSTVNVGDYGTSRYFLRSDNKGLAFTDTQHFSTALDDTNSTDELGDNNYRFCAIQRDVYGHVVNTIDIDIIDGNW